MKILQVSCKKTQIILVNPTESIYKPQEFASLMGQFSYPPTKRSAALAEIIGIVLGDGSIYLKERTYQVRIAGNSENGREYLVSYVRRLFKSVFHVEARTKFVKNTKAMYLCIDLKHVALELIRHGLFPGDRRKTDPHIPCWIFDNKEYLRSCIRGLIDTDGTVYPKTLRHPSASIWFTTALPSLRDDFANAMRSLGFHLSKWVARSNGRDNIRYDTCIGKSIEALTYFKEVGFSNPHYHQRFLKYLRDPDRSIMNAPNEI